MVAQSVQLFIPKTISKKQETLDLDIVGTLQRGYGLGHQVYDKGIQTPPVGSYKFFYFMAKYESGFRTCNEILKMYHFREGLEWINQKKYANQAKKLEKFFSMINHNYQTLEEILKEIESDLNIADDAYVVFNKDYIVDTSSGEIVYAHINEIVRGSPEYYRIVSNYYGRIGGTYGRCLVCEVNKQKEDKSLYNTQIYGRIRHSFQEVYLYESLTQDKDGKYVCPECGSMLHDVEYIISTEADNNDPIYYHIKGEVIHLSKYDTSRLYGLSPIITLANHMDIRIKLMQYLQTFLEYRRVPEGAIFINTGDPKNVKAALEQAQKKYMEDRYYQPIIAVNAEKSGGNFIQYVKFTPLPEELKMQDQMTLIRREIASLLGVQNVMLNDLEGVGGLNSESLQVQVTDRAALAGQRLYNNKLFPRMLEQLGMYGQFDIPDDLRLIVQRTDNSENESRLFNLNQEILIALAVADMGYEIEPDFVNLLGAKGEKLLPFSFRKLSKQEMMEAQGLGLIDRGDTVENVKPPARPHLSGVRRKEDGSIDMDNELDKLNTYKETLENVEKLENHLLKQYNDFDNHTLELIQKGLVDVNNLQELDNIRINSNGEMVYKLYINKYLYRYVPKEIYDAINQQKVNLIEKEKLDRIEKQKQRIAKYIYSPENRNERILSTAVKKIYDANPNQSYFDIACKAVEIYVEIV